MLISTKSSFFNTSSKTIVSLLIYCQNYLLMNVVAKVSYYYHISFNFFLYMVKVFCIYLYIPVLGTSEFMNAIFSF